MSESRPQAQFYRESKTRWHERITPFKNSVYEEITLATNLVEPENGCLGEYHVSFYDFKSGPTAIQLNLFGDGFGVFTTDPAHVLLWSILRAQHSDDRLDLHFTPDELTEAALEAGFVERTDLYEPY